MSSTKASFSGINHKYTIVRYFKQDVLDKGTVVCLTSSKISHVIGNMFSVPCPVIMENNR